MSTFWREKKFPLYKWISNFFFDIHWYITAAPQEIRSLHTNRVKIKSMLLWLIYKSWDIPKPGLAVVRDIHGLSLL